MKNYLILFIGYLLIGCSEQKEELTAKEFLSWSNEKHDVLRKNKSMNHLNYEVMYKPSNLILAEELANGVITQADVESRKKSLEGLLHFQLRIKQNTDGKNRKQKLFEPTTEIDAYLSANKKIKCDPVFILPVNHHGMTPFMEYLIVFNASPADIKNGFKLHVRQGKATYAELSFDNINKNIPELIPVVN